MNLGLILLYHRVAEPLHDPWGLSVSPQHFSQHLEAAKRLARIVRVIDVAEHPDEPGLRLAFSFDDGYADNLCVALPMLEQFEVPATFFIPTGIIDSDNEFWWDEIERLVLGSHALPDTLTLDGELPLTITEALVSGHPPSGWRAWETPRTDRERLYLLLWERCRDRTPAEQQRLLIALRAWAGDSASARSSHRAMSSGELRQLASSKLVTVGAHTRNHVRLSTLTRQQQRDEIQSSVDDLRALKMVPLAFSYPYGGPSDYTDETIAEVRRLGFTVACANGLVPRTEHPDALRLPRLFVQNWDGDEFARQVLAAASRR